MTSRHISVTRLRHLQPSAIASLLKTAAPIGGWRAPASSTAYSTGIRGEIALTIKGEVRYRLPDWGRVSLASSSHRSDT